MALNRNIHHSDHYDIHEGLHSHNQHGGGGGDEMAWLVLEVRIDHNTWAVAAPAALALAAVHRLASLTWGIAALVPCTQVAGAAAAVDRSNNRDDNNPAPAHDHPYRRQNSTERSLQSL